MHHWRVQEDLCHLVVFNVFGTLINTVLFGFWIFDLNFGLQIVSLIKVYNVLPDCKVMIPDEKNNNFPSH